MIKLKFFTALMTIQEVTRYLRLVNSPLISGSRLVINHAYVSKIASAYLM